MHRVIDRYDPFADAAKRWPGWEIKFSHLAGITAVFSAARQVFLLDSTFWRGREAEAVATAVAHLDLSHQKTPGGFTVEQQDVARCLAQIRMDPERV